MPVFASVRTLRTIRLVDYIFYGNMSWFVTDIKQNYIGKYSNIRNISTAGNTQTFVKSKSDFKLNCPN